MIDHILYLLHTRRYDKRIVILNRIHPVAKVGKGYRTESLGPAARYNYPATGSVIGQPLVEQLGRTWLAHLSI